MDNYNLDSLQSMAAGQPNDPQFSASIASVRNLLRTAQQMIEEPSVTELPFMAFGSVGRILSFHGSPSFGESEEPGLVSDVNQDPEEIVPTTLVGGRTGTDAMIRATASRRRYYRLIMHSLT